MSSDSAPITPPLSPVLVRNKKKGASCKDREPDGEDFTPSQNERLVTYLERLEQIEQDRKVRREYFRKTDSPVPVPVPLPTACDVLPPSLDIPADTPRLDFPLEIHKDFPGFRTSAGNEVVISQELLEENLKLFEDILTPTQSSSTRTNKFNYLTRPKRDCSESSAFKGFEEEEVRTAQLQLKLLGELEERLTQEEAQAHSQRMKLETNSVDVPEIERMELDGSNLRKRTRDEIELSGDTEWDETMFKKPKVALVPRNQTEQRSVDSISGTGETLKLPEESLKETCNILGVKVNKKPEFLGKTTQAISKSKLAFFDNLLEDQESYSDNQTTMQESCGKPSARNVNFEVMNSGCADPSKETKGSRLPRFTSASGKPWKLSESSRLQASEIWKDFDLKGAKSDGDEANPCENTSDAGDSRNKQNTSTSLPVKATNCLFPGFTSASGKSFKLPETALQKAKLMFKDIDNPETRDQKNPSIKETASPADLPKETKAKETDQNVAFPRFSSASGKSLKLSEKALRKANTIFKDIANFETRDPKNPTNKETACPTDLPKETAIDTSFPEFLGSPTSFNLDNKDPSSKTPKPGSSRDPRSFSTPQNQTKPRRKLGMSSCKQISIPERTLRKVSSLFDEDLSGISPIKPTVNHTTPNNRNALIPEKSGIRSGQVWSTPIGKSLFKETPTVDNGSFTMTPTERGSGKTWIENLEDQKQATPTVDNGSFTITPTERGNGKTWIEDLEKEKRELQKRLEVITERQRRLIQMEENATVIDRRPKMGALLQKKCRSGRTSLRDFVGNRKPGDGGVTNPLWCVTPQNAEQFHFIMCDTTTLTTEDGCVIVPNPKNLVGLHEVEHSFRHVPGVEPSLLPEGWIRNHYRWVIWKLASYERAFPVEFNGALCVENVIQQLKYRYDREIDKAERSAVRKIFEKDDAAQKRMVLCVSDVRKTGANTFTLELTDGWYGIKTIIDDPLCNQITNGRLTIGTKLVTYNAELLNCDGCPPLEATDLISLRINYNCTRRAKWDARLGYQDRLGPFPVSIGSIDPNGGMVGLVTINIVRAYPLRFLEKSNGQSVWRNRRAEERRAQQWENERDKQMERIHEEVQQQYDRCRDGCSDEGLTQALNLKVREEVEKLNNTKRDVVSTFKLLITDGNGDGTRTFNFWVWSPTEWHLDMLKEGSSYMVYNVFPRKNGDLSSSKKTFFKPSTKRIETPDVFKRRITTIDRLTEKELESFHEFDTVGLVADVRVDKYQFVWLSDRSGRLLLIKIYESPRTCPLPDIVRRGQAVTVCNVTFRTRHPNDITEAVGSSSTIFSMYSQYKHLQEGLKDFKANLPEDCDGLLDGCAERIKLFNANRSDRADSFVSDDDDDEGTLTNSKLTRTDIALSLMDINIDGSK